MQHILLLLGTLLTGLFLAWPVLGEVRLPLSAFAPLVRILALVALTGALVVWDVKRRHATAEIEKVHGIRVAEVPGPLTALVGGPALVVLLLSFGFEQQIVFEALVERNPEGRRQGALAFLERFPHADLIDAAFDYLLEGDDFLETASKVYPSLVPDLQARAATRVLDRIGAEKPGKAGGDLATFVTLFEGEENAARARRSYVEQVVPRYLALPKSELSDGARAILRAIAESAGGPRVGLVIEPAKDAPAPIEMLAGRLQRILASRAPFQVMRGSGAEHVPRRLEVRWSRTGDLLEARVSVVAALGGGRAVRLFESRYLVDLADADPHARDRFAEAPIRDVLPPP